jgi:hypothetical protein
MREYLTVENLWRAAAWSALVTCMAIPRILQTAQSLAFYLPATFVSLMLVAGAVTAWGSRGGMVGPLPAWRRLLAGVGVAALLVLVWLPLATPMDALLRQALTASGKAGLIQLAYPNTPGGCWALLLWSAGFETLFFQGAAMAFVARITGRQDVAIIGAVALRVYVTHRKLTMEGLAPVPPVALYLSALSSLVACLLFARGGLPAAMTFAAGVSARHFLSLLR